MSTTADDRPTRRLLSVDDVSAMLGLPRQTIYRLVRESRLPAVAVGRFYRFDRIAIERWIDAGGAR